MEGDSHKIQVDFPRWMVEALDREASRLGIPRQAVIKVLIDSKLKELGHEQPQEPTPKTAS